MVYGLVDVPQDQMGHIKGKAVLKGEVSGQQVKHVVQFSSRPAGAANTSDIFPVHRLAAKALIADWQDAGRSKGDIVSVSVESSVISRHTAFIAVDEDSSSPVQGALQTWDIKTNLVEQGLFHSFSQSYSYDRYCQEAPMNMGDKGAGFSICKRRRSRSRSRSRERPTSRYSYADDMLLCYDEDDDEDDDEPCYSRTVGHGSGRKSVS